MDEDAATAKAKEELTVVRRWARSLFWQSAPDQLGAVCLVLFFLSRGLDVESAIAASEDILYEDGRIARVREA